MGIRVGICGTGVCRQFHPAVQGAPAGQQVILADLHPSSWRIKRADSTSDTLSSLDALCASNVDAIAIITQHHLHGPRRRGVAQRQGCLFRRQRHHLTRCVPGAAVQETAHL